MFDILDKLHEECGLVGIYSENYQHLGPEIADALISLQHRGQESAGIAVAHEGVMMHYKNIGLVRDVFNEENLRPFNGNIGIGHCRYSTVGSVERRNAQPLVVEFKAGTMALGHNGNLINAVEIRENLIDQGFSFTSTSDSEIIIKLIAIHYKGSPLEAIKKALCQVKGGFALVLIVEGKLYGARDSNGLRPLVLGQKDNGDYVIASETCALDILEAKFIREVDKGEIVEIDGSGYSSHYFDDSKPMKLCSFEFVYFSRPDSDLMGKSVYEARVEFGRILARKDSEKYDFVAAVPESGVPAAIGYAKESGTTYSMVFIKNKYIGRTFINPTQEDRERALRLKLAVLKNNIKGKRIVVVDDSIIRGTTLRSIVHDLKRAGAKEVHVRIGCPPVAYSCFFGIDTPSKKSLISANMSEEEIGEYIGADSLKFLTPEDVTEALGLPEEDLCRACFTGDYPMEVPKTHNKYVFEKY
ncbi:MAG: amidophosphoribosyltransferase [Tissierellia bacterium]|nr:amidophosphoribosyltransferase [Tissierellia bacterium]